MTVHRTPARVSSQAVSRLPCSSGRVSGTITLGPWPTPVQGVDRGQRRADPAGGERAGIADRCTRWTPTESAARRARRSARTSRGPRPRWRCASGAARPRRSSPAVSRLRAPLHPTQRPVQVHRGGPRGAEERAAPAANALRGPRCAAASIATTHRGGDADQRGPAHPERANRLGHGVHRIQIEVPLLAREQRLIEDADGACRRPGDGMREWARRKIARAPGCSS